MTDTQVAGQQIRDALSAVREPQLQRSITTLGFVSGVQIDDGRVHVRLRIPTYFRARSFAMMVAADAGAAVRALPWVESVEVCLHDPGTPEPQQSGAGSSHVEPMALDQAWLRHRRDAFLARQHALLRDLLERGLRRSELCGLSVGDLPTTPDTAVYLQRRAELGLPTDSGAALVMTADGTPVSADEIDDHLARIRDVTVGRFTDSER